ncbi:TPA: hypothetical protein U7L95_000440 [Streptococcus agalactiae]|nr:hypothetical protein [Streptococcus agalactiae]HEN7642184.1 hypothetical protein [Streptococcus agalactiae]
MAKLSRKTVKDLCLSITKATLEFEGYELLDESGYILAHKEGETDLLIYPLAKQFSDKESPQYKADYKAVTKLDNFVKSYPEEIVPYISYSFIKNELSHLETVIAPITLIRKIAQTGSVFSNASGHLYLNVELTSNLPEDVFHSSWIK